MTTNRKMTLGTCILFSVSSVIVTSMPSSASPPTRFEVCLAILTEPICDLVRTPQGESAGRGTKPAVVDVAEDRAIVVDIACAGTPMTNAAVCPS